MFRNKKRTSLPFPAAPQVDPLAAVSDHHQKVKLVGKVAGVQSCELLTEGTEIIVGSAITCDLVVLDPLAPRKAFRLIHTKDHAGGYEKCDESWIIEPAAGSRVYLNHTLARREPIRFGDTISLGCHHFVFSTAEAGARDCKGNVRVDDLCRDLIRGGTIPTGYLNASPNWRDRIRTRRAGVFGAVIAALLLACFFLFRNSNDIFESIQPPLEVTINNQVLIPAGESMTSLAKVQRKSFNTPENPQPSDLQPTETPKIEELTADTIRNASTPALPPPPSELDRTVEDAGPMLRAVANIEINDTPVVLKQERQKLGQTSPIQRKYTREQAEQIKQVADMGVVRASVTRADMASTASTKYANQLSRQPHEKPTLDLSAQRADVLAALQPTKTEFTDYKGQRIPIARIPSKLETLAVTGSEPKRGIEVDGSVTTEESAISFKTGRFRIHGPGTPPEANPATYCYVSKTQVSGKDYLYVAFVNSDPNLAQLITTRVTGSAQLCNDDSIEIFIDIDGNRTDYHQLIVNAKGEYFATACPNGDLGINGEGSPWNASPIIKTTINRDAAQWVCEVLIPYDAFPSVPAKGTKIPVNFCRNFRGQASNNPNYLQNWFSVWEGTSQNYHHPRLFGLLEWP
ncbi:MAG: hypothetical protein IT444_06360 [Phycisphaeraceae bacterium]|nr:hypothetical protein [Phycisphaeraceae bacterium]